MQKKSKIYWQFLNEFKWELTNLFDNKLLTKNNGHCERLFHWEFIGFSSKICGSFNNRAKYNKLNFFFVSVVALCAEKN